MSKILYIGGFELPDKNAAAQRVIGNAKVLRALGYEVVFIGVNKNKEELSEPRYFEGFRYYEIKYPESIKEWINYLTGIKHVKQILDKEEDISKLIAYNYPAAALNKLRKTGIEVYADCTEWYEPEGSLLFRLIKGWDVRYRMKVIHKKLKGIIVISDYLENYYKNSLTTINIPPLVDFKDEKWAGSKEEKKDSIIFCYSGSPGTGNKDRIDVVIKTLADLQKQTSEKIKLNVIGITEEYFKEVFDNGPDTSFDLSFVRFLGRKSHRESLDILKECDYFIFFRINGLANKAGFPTKFVEAVTLGIPVITNSSSNIEKYLKESDELGMLIDIEKTAEAPKKILAYCQKPGNIHLDGNKTFDYRNSIEEFQKLFPDINSKSNKE